MLLLQFVSACFAVIVASATNIRPLVVWHGLGDYASSEGMLELQALFKKEYPSIFVHSVYISEDEDLDRRAGFYGSSNEQIELAAAQIQAIPELKHGFDAIGGQFLRAYVERYNNPPINNLITFGSQHMGISDLPVCKRYDFVCQLARRAAKAAVYGDWAQQNIIQAQYYRDPYDYGTYLMKNRFLASINNEVPDQRNQTYAANLASLSNLVLVLFTEDKTVVPKESAWFGSEPIPAPDYSAQSRFTAWNGDDRIPMRKQPLYLEDWIGLRKLDEKGGVTLKICKGEHMEMNACWREIVAPYIGGEM
ncbi:palmitoyl-protein thioesterase [Pterulicium gracile]|uniref:palmitoyl-protein hydrolase n=1 Tax=Pterulicium gracile TaxID=1884261 RepID=A0A5C3QVP0_9AGAR|nr:palmitoyl-protein thioesterase [Pterula gracilis]